MVACPTVVASWPWMEDVVSLVGEDYAFGDYAIIAVEVLVTDENREPVACDGQRLRVVVVPNYFLPSANTSESTVS